MAEGLHTEPPRKPRQRRDHRVAQRLHEDDLFGELKREGGWFELCLPAITTHDEEIPVSKILSYKRREGHPLRPARQSLRTLRAVQKRDPIEFAAQHQQDPIPREGNYADPEWFGIFDEPPTGGIVCMSCDTASQTGINNDH